MNDWFRLTKPPGFPRPFHHGRLRFHEANLQRQMNGIEIVALRYATEQVVRNGNMDREKESQKDTQKRVTSRREMRDRTAPDGIAQHLPPTPEGNNLSTSRSTDCETTHNGREIKSRQTVLRRMARTPRGEQNGKHQGVPVSKAFGLLEGQQDASQFGFVNLVCLVNIDNLPTQKYESFR